MISEKRSIGMGLQGSYSFQEVNGNLSQVQYGLGVSVFERRWVPIYKAIIAHVDIQGSYLYSELMPNALNSNHAVQIGVLPGISWFFHPKWSLEGRLGGLNGQYYRSNNRGSSVSLMSMRYNVNPFDMQFAISRFF